MDRSDHEKSPTAAVVLTPVPLSSVLPSGIHEYIPSCHDDLKPKMDKVFKTLDEGEKFYKEYAKACGFDTRLSSTTKKRGTDDFFTLRNVLCNRAGEREKSKKRKTNRVRKITRIGCKAMVQFKRQKDNTYIVSIFHEGHNHILASPESMLFMKENRSMTSVQKNFVVKAARLKLGAVRAYRGWKELSGGYKNIGASEVDFKNFVRDLKGYIGDFDGQLFIENFIRKQETCSSFYFNFQVDENKRLCRVFWADTISRRNYGIFGDMCSVDATYKTNKYDMVFVPFTGVDHHKRCVTFGAGFLAHEDSESYTWLFSTFLDAMNNQQPKVLLTDQDPGMKIAIENVFTDTVHRLCMWHIMKKLREKVSAYLWQSEDFKKSLNRCVWSNVLDPIQFETAWADIMIKNELVDDSWFSHLFDIREQWIPAYFKDLFMGGIMRVTSISESENSFFDRFVTPHVTLVEFWMCFESAMDAQRHKQAKINTENKHSSPPLETPLALEKHASEVYTHNLFMLFQKEVVASLYNCGMDDVNKNDDTEVYIIHDLEPQNNTCYKVTYASSTKDVTCACCLFERMGILCRHAIWVLKTKKVQSIPQKYIVNRWTKDAMKKPVFDKNGEVLEVGESRYDKKKLTEELWEEVYSCVSVAEENDEDMNKLIEKLREIRLEMETSRTTTNKTKDKQKELERFVGCSVPKELTIHAPKRSINKGSGKRIESQVLKAINKKSKKVRFCKKCGKQGHNSSTCQAIVKETVVESSAIEEAKLRLCKTCGESGHDSRKCKKNEAPKTRYCKNCGKSGHNSRTCEDTTCHEDAGEENDMDACEESDMDACEESDEE